MASRKLIVEIVGDSRSLERAFGRSSRSADKFNRGLTANLGKTKGMLAGLAGPIAAIGSAIGGAAVVGGVKLLVDAASDLNEQISRTGFVFGDSAKEIEAWSTTTANSIGISQAEALEAAGNFGTMFHTIGVGNQQAASMSRTLTVLASDMASMNNQDPSEMLDRIRSGLAGEAEPLRRFGILISEARVQQEAYRSGIARVGSKLTEQQKVQARYNILLHDSALQQGDFARTSNSLANQQRILSAQIGDLAAKLGAVLLPYVTRLVTKITDWMSNTQNQERLTRFLETAVDDLVIAIQALIDAAQWVIDAWNVTKLWFQQFWVDMKIGAYEGFLGIVEPFSHLPSKLGGKFREAKDAATSELYDLRSRAAVLGAETGDVFGQNFAGALNEHLAIMNRTVKETAKAVPEPQKFVPFKAPVIPAIPAPPKIPTSSVGGGGARLSAEERKRRAEEERQRRLEEAAARRRASQFRLLGLTPTGEKPLPAVENLRQQLASLSKRVAGTNVGRQNRALLNRIRKLLALDTLEPEVRGKIRDLFEAIRSEIDKGAKSLEGLRTRYKTRPLNIDAFIAGLGPLTPAQVKALRGKLTQVQPGGGVKSGRTAAFAGQGRIVVAGNVNLYGVQDVPAFEAALIRRTGSRPTVRRGST